MIVRLLIVLGLLATSVFAAINSRESALIVMTKSGTIVESKNVVVQTAPLPGRSGIVNNSSAQSKIVLLDRIVVFVNKAVVTTTQVNKAIDQALANFRLKGIAAPSDLRDVRARVIDQLVMRRIELDLATRGGIKVSDLEVLDAINNIARAQNMSLDEFKQYLAKNGFTFDGFQKQIQEQIIMEKLKQREVDSRVVVNDDEVNRVINSESYKSQVDYNLSYIVINVPEQASNDVVMAKAASANEAYARLKAGENFTQVSIKYSDAPDALNGGELGWKSSIALPPVIVNSFKGLKPGEFSEVLHLPMGFFIFKVNAVKMHGAAQLVKQYHVRHILIKVNEITGDDESSAKIYAIYRMLKPYEANESAESQRFTELAREYSQDTSSVKGGDIGWVAQGDTVPQFESVVMTSKLRHISEPVRSPFGWHIIEVLDVRQSNLAGDRERSEIRQELRENKATVLYNQWLRDIREAAYVKMNDE